MVRAGDFKICDLFEAEDLGEEIHRPVHVAHRDSDRVERRNSRLIGREPSRSQPEESGESKSNDEKLPFIHFSLSIRWSPTRSAFAMTVRAGFVAPQDGKKLASTTYRLSRS